MLSDSSSISSSPKGETAFQPLSGWVVALLALIATVILYYGAEFIGGIVVLLLPSVIPALHGQSRSWVDTSVVAQFIYGVIADGLLVAGVACMLKLFNWQWAKIGLVIPKLRHLAMGLLAVVPYYFFYIAIVMLISGLVPSLDITQKQDIGFNIVHGFGPLAMAFISLVILPPIAEEIVMRGFLYTSLKQWLPKVSAALVVSVLFGAAHLAEGGAAGPLWIGAIDTFTLSLVLVFLREQTGGLGASIVLHAAKNFIAFYTLFIIQGR